ncbi:DUF883 family protein [Deefgea salmonis]|uniref:DUF883 domain-containing protein n=1 Tax=Deefgea salmonis TaxID=2875502 RepID=A0ABS8BHI4_9NEIS|nr:DUF883 domain-containing protein [Deefgea salmonis]MCB5195082.1 DUF883 domain-containing protein [Deefgea salmonis]
MSEASESMLIDETKDVLQETADLMNEAANASPEESKKIYAKIAANLCDAKHRLAEIEAVAVNKAKVAAQQTDQYVHAHPWQAVGVGAAVGLLIGFLAARR